MTRFRTRLLDPLQAGSVSRDDAGYLRLKDSAEAHQFDAQAQCGCNE